MKVLKNVFVICVFLLHRDGFTSTLGIDGLRISGKEKQMAKAAFTQSMVMFSLATSKRDGGMAAFCVSMLMGQGSIFLMMFLSFF